MSVICGFKVLPRAYGPKHGTGLLAGEPLERLDPMSEDKIVIIEDDDITTLGMRDGVV
jgi:hypothetical protein